MSSETPGSQQQGRVYKFTVLMAILHYNALVKSTAELSAALLE